MKMWSFVLGSGWPYAWKLDKDGELSNKKTTKSTQHCDGKIDTLLQCDTNALTLTLTCTCKCFKCHKLCGSAHCSPTNAPSSDNISRSDRHKVNSTRYDVGMVVMVVSTSLIIFNHHFHADRQTQSTFFLPIHYNVVNFGTQFYSCT